MRQSSRNILVILIGIVICLGLTGVLLVSCGIGGYLIGQRILSDDAWKLTDPRVNTEVTDFKATTVNGEEFQLSALKGRPVILNFWASWCAPCVEEMTTLQTNSTAYSDEVYIVGINADEPRRDVLEFIEEHGLTFPIVLDPDSRIQKLFNIRGYPTTFVIDSDGIIRAVHLGYLSDKIFTEYLVMVGVD